ncbi:hypothetical protein [Reinekea sp. G2M2-21]|uniref:hypothetical protein n=1 Tax=Reinekea sp. G2M2-21 TaxID=2788942 RepID=UPI0018A94B08|nr:hypothetical protein [Reinekea sp. G2M2-21]
MFKKIIALLLSFGAASFVVANPTCTGFVSNVSLSTGGGVYATIRNGDVSLKDVTICGLNSTSGAFSAEACIGLYSMLLSAVAMSEDVTLWFYQDKFSSCSLNWANLADFGFYHFRLNK